MFTNSGVCHPEAMDITIRHGRKIDFDSKLDIAAVEQFYTVATNILRFVPVLYPPYFKRISWFNGGRFRLIFISVRKFLLLVFI